jgi:hypothetical protein
MLPDDVLLEIFYFRVRVTIPWYSFRPVEWHFLMHVCRRWRQIIFQSPNRLKLEIFCTRGTPVRKNLDIWPAFPIGIYHRFPLAPSDEDNVIAALEHPDRVCAVLLNVTSSQLQKIATVMQDVFPRLTDLYISSDDEGAPLLTDGFLGGSAPCLQHFELHGITYPTLPTFLLSASDLTRLELHKIPPTSYISPEAMVACLAALPRLAMSGIGFQSATSRPHRVRPPPVIRTVLPALTHFEFCGASEYLEDLAARIDVPRLAVIYTHYLNQLVDFQVAQFFKFIERSVGPILTASSHVEVTFSRGKISFAPTDASGNWRPAKTYVSCQGTDWQVSHMAQVLSQFSTILSNVVHLVLKVDPEEDFQLEGTEDVEWLHLLRQFSTVQMLYVSQELAGHVALALQDITGDMVAEVLPSLNLICLDGQLASSIEKFITVCQLSGHPVTHIDDYARWISIQSN